MYSNLQNWMLLVDDFQCSLASFLIDNEWNFDVDEIVKILQLPVGGKYIGGGGASGEYTVERLPDFEG